MADGHGASDSGDPLQDTSEPATLVASDVEAFRNSQGVPIGGAAAQLSPWLAAAAGAVLAFVGVGELVEPGYSNVWDGYEDLLALAASASLGTAAYAAARGSVRQVALAAATAVALLGGSLIADAWGDFATEEEHVASDAGDGISIGDGNIVRGSIGENTASSGNGDGALRSAAQDLITEHVPVAVRFLVSPRRYPIEFDSERCILAERELAVAIGGTWEAPRLRFFASGAPWTRADGEPPDRGGVCTPDSAAVLDHTFAQGQVVIWRLR